MRLPLSLAALAATTHHRAPSGWFLAALILLALLYLAWRAGRLGKLRGAVAALRLRNELRGLRISPMALLPTLLLVIVVVVLIFSHS